MYEADGTRREHKNYTSDNCNDQGSIPTNGGVYDTDYGSGNSYNFRNIGIYSTYNGGNRAGRAEVFYSDDNSNWTYSFESYVETNSQCGERIGTVTAELLPGDIAIDTRTNFKASSGNNVGNYCTLNPLQDRWNIGSSGTRNFSQGNLKITATTGDSTRSRYRLEQFQFRQVVVLRDDSRQHCWYRVGFAPRQFADEDTSISVSITVLAALLLTDYNSSPKFYNGDIIGVALNLDNYRPVYKNGATVGNATNFVWHSIFTFWWCHLQALSTAATFNFGWFSFETVRLIIKVLHANLSDPDILVADISSHFLFRLWRSS